MKVGQMITILVVDEYKKIPLVPKLNACSFPDPVNWELADADISTHYSCPGFHIDWNDPADMPETQKWLQLTYGPKIQDYRSFEVDPT